jgi:VanZ family protein
MIRLNGLIRAAAAFTFVFTLVLLWAFLTPISQLPKTPDISDYVWHFAIFAVLVIPLSTVLPKQGGKIAFAAVLFGTAIECIQPYFGRGFEAHDLLSNAIGIVAGWCISMTLVSVFRSN